MLVRLLLAALVTAGPVLAQRAERPEATPRIDVAVTYTVTGPEVPPGEMRIAFHASSGTFRVDPVGSSAIHILAQRGQARAVMVMEARQAFLELDAGANMLRDLELALASGRATRLGSLRIAEAPCINWRLPEPALGQACISPRGVLLKRETPQGVVMEAIFIEQREQDVERFRIPAGYRAIGIDEMVETDR